MTTDRVLAEQLRQLMSDSFRQPPRVDEDQRAAMRVDQFDHTSVDLGPMLVGADGAEFQLRHFNREVELARVADVDDGATEFRAATVRERSDARSLLRSLTVAAHCIAATLRRFARV